MRIQYEFKMADAFNLAGERSEDGERLTREMESKRVAALAAKEWEAKHQAELMPEAQETP